jgi:ribosomal protein S18 acetylase RimI-like enzyme
LINGDPTFAEMEPRHAEAVGRLHMRYMEHSLLTDLGAGVVAPLYASLLESRYGAGYVASIGDDVVGFSFGRFAGSSPLPVVIARSWRRMLRPLVKLSLTHPRALARAALRITEPGHPPAGDGVAELVSIVVSDRARGTNASKRLGEMLFDRLKQEGCSTIRWETMSTNVRAQQYYAKIGGRIIGRAKAGGDEILWYELGA